ncbi:MAG TPA: hypothetical protein EYH34_15570, partial [Planctomycetes bacterium]|nr:hypothetical protein [Planctomycetota bacterium]
MLLADETSREVLLAHWEALERGQVPPATEMSLSQIAGAAVFSSEQGAPQTASAQTEPEEDRSSQPGNSTSTKRRIPFETADFGGRLCERGQAGDLALTEEFQAWLKGSDCLLFFLAVDQLQDREEAEERLLEVDALLNELAESSPEGQAVSHPLAILITKWDLVSDLSGSLEEEQGKLREFLADKAGGVGRGVIEKIEAAGEYVALFPVSTFGGHQDGRPICPLRPFNLHLPLRWALEQTDRLLYRKAHRESRGALRRPLWKPYKRAIKYYEKLENEYGITAGPVYEEAQRQLKPLRSQRRNRTLVVSVLVAILLLSAAAAGMYMADQRTHNRLVQDIETNSPAYEQLSARVRAYLESPNPWARLSRRKRDIKAKWQNYLDQLRADFERLNKTYESPPDQPKSLAESIEHWEDFIRDCNQFLGQYRGSPEAQLAIEWKEDGGDRLAELRFCQNVESLVEDWEQSDAASDRLEGFSNRTDELDRDYSLLGGSAVSQCVQDARADLQSLRIEIDRYRRFDQDYADLKLQGGSVSEDTVKLIDQFVREHPRETYAKRAG